jgi:hypothetical protein
MAALGGVRELLERSQGVVEGLRAAADGVAERVGRLEAGGARAAAPAEITLTSSRDPALDGSGLPELPELPELPQLPAGPPS